MLNWFRKRFQVENTRQYPRLPAAWPVKVEPLTSGDGRQVSRTEDVSAGGFSVILPHPLARGTRIRFQIHISPIDRIVQAEGEVVRSRPLSGENRFDVGVRFIQIDPADQAKLNETIESISGPGESRRKRDWWRSV